MSNENKKDEGLLMMLVSWVMQMTQSYQRRKNDDNMPYSIHPQMVASNIPLYLSEMGNLRARLAAICHDIVEDCVPADLARTFEYWNDHLPHYAIDAKPSGNVRDDLYVLLQRCVEVSGYPPVEAEKIISAVEELSVPEEMTGVYELGDKKAKKAWEASPERMQNMSDEALMVMWADKSYNLRSPIPGRDPVKEQLKYGRLFFNIQSEMNARGFAPLAVPADIYSAMVLYTQN